MVISSGTVQPACWELKEVKAFYQLDIIEFLIPCLSPSILPTLYAPDTFIHSSNKYLSVYYVPDQGGLARYRLERTRGEAITGAWEEWRDGEGHLTGSMQPTLETQKGGSG